PSNGGNFFGDDRGHTSQLPRLGTVGSMGDLDVAMRDGVILRAAAAEVWLGANAPPDTVDKLRAAGLSISDDQTIDAAVDAAGQRPSAVGWRFFVLLGVLALVLGAAGLLLAAAVERRPRANALRAMRIQGLSARTIATAGLIGYLSFVLCGAIFGAG